MLTQLPDEILGVITKYLSTCEKLRLSETCKRMNSFIAPEGVFKKERVATLTDVLNKRISGTCRPNHATGHTLISTKKGWFLFEFLASGEVKFTWGFPHSWGVQNSARIHHVAHWT